MKPWLAGLALALAALVAAPAKAGGALYSAGSFDDRIDLVVREGFDRPDAALMRLDALAAEAGASPAGRRAMLQSRGMIEAQAGRTAQAGEHADQLLSLAKRSGDPLAAAASALVRALVAETAGQVDVAAALARPAIDVFQAGCGTPSAWHVAAAAEACDYRSAWRSLHILARRSMSQGRFVEASGELSSAIGLAEHAGDRWRQGFSLSASAYPAFVNGHAEGAGRALRDAWRLAEATADPALSARVRGDEARLADARGDRAGAARLSEEALAMAQRGNATRMTALLLGNLSDLYAKLGRPEQSLRAAETALATVRLFNDRRAERVLTNNAGLAKIGLGRIAEAKQDLARLLELWQVSGSLADQATSLREFGQALAVAGDAPGALELYHRERAVTAEVVRRSRESALAEMQHRFDAEAKERSIELLNRDNALKAEALSNHQLLLQNWSIGATVLALSVAVAIGLYRRVRRIQRQLEATQATLRVQSRCDALTNLANRRYLHEVMDAAGSAPGDGFEGAILLIDIDHFKAINDRFGHGAGDAVLVEFGRRLTAAVRAEDLVVRWGGEEFLIVAARLTAERSHQLAARLLERISGESFDIQDRRLRVTASIGYGRFPLEAGRPPLPWRQGLHLVDLAMYSAKTEGRNQAMGIVSAADPLPAGSRRPVSGSAWAAHGDALELLQRCGEPC